MTAPTLATIRREIDGCRPCDAPRAHRLRQIQMMLEAAERIRTEALALLRTIEGDDPEVRP